MVTDGRAMSPQAIRDEILEALNRGLGIAWEVSILPALRDLTEEQRDVVRALLTNLNKERAANIGGSYAGRIVPDHDKAEGLAVNAARLACKLMEEALETARVRNQKDPRHNDRKRLALAKMRAACALWSQQ